MTTASKATATAISFTIKRSKRKTMGIYVNHGGVEVRAPHHIDDDVISQWVNEKTDWISKQLATQAIKDSQRLKLEDGEHVLFLGQVRTLRIITGEVAIFEKGSNLIISTANPQQDAQAYFESWIRTEAELYITERCFELAYQMKLDDRILSIHFKKTKSKWGHCTSQGKLQFNWLIIMAPPSVIDYLLIHELSHLVHMNHSQSFWRLVENFCPRYQQEKSWLDDHGHRIWL